MALLASAQELPDYLPTDGLIGWWPFSGSADDASGNGNHGLVMGGVMPALDRFGEENSAYEFPGNLAAFIEVELNESADSLTLGFSVSSWYRTSTTFGDRRVLQIGNTDSGARGVMLMLSGGGPWTARTHSGFIETMAGRIGAWPTPVQSIKEEWAHLVFTSNFITGQWQVFQNGVIQAQGQTVNPVGYDPLNLSDLPFNIGTKAPFGFFQGDAWHGELDDIGIWRRVLTDCEVLDLFAAELHHLNVDAGEDLWVCPDEEVMLVATSNGAVSWNNEVLDSVAFTVTEPAVYVASASIGGCLATDTLFIELLQPTFATDSVEACGEFMWIDGVTYTQSIDSALWVMTNAAGCDSIVTLNLTVLQPDIVTQVVKACDTFTWLDGLTYTSDTDSAQIVLTNAAGCDSIVTLLLTIDTLQIFTHPVDQTTVLSAGAEFTFQSSAVQPTLQWQSDFGNGFEDLTDGGQYFGTENPILSVVNASFANDMQPFRCVIINGACTDTTDVAFLNVCGSVTLQPENQFVLAGSSAEFTVASNDPEAAFQWQTNIGFGFQNLSDAGQYNGTTTPTLIVSNISENNANQLFRCLVASRMCETPSEEAVLTIDPGVGVLNQKGAPFKVWPNPAGATLNLEVGHDLIGEPYTLFDLNGRMLASGLITADRSYIDLSGVAPGVYFLSVGSTMRHTSRVIKH